MDETGQQLPYILLGLVNDLGLSWIKQISEFHILYMFSWPNQNNVATHYSCAVHPIN